MNTFMLNLPYMILFLISGFAIVYYLRNKHLEKMEIIRNGESLVMQDALEQMKLQSLGRGIILISLSFGIFTAYLLTQLAGLEPWATYIFSLLFFSGLGSVILYLLIRNK